MTKAHNEMTTNATEVNMKTKNIKVIQNINKTKIKTGIKIV